MRVFCVKSTWLVDSPISPLPRHINKRSQNTLLVFKIGRFYKYPLRKCLKIGGVTWASRDRDYALWRCCYFCVNFTRLENSLSADGFQFWKCRLLLWFKVQGYVMSHVTSSSSAPFPFYCKSRKLSGLYEFVLWRPWSLSKTETDISRAQTGCFLIL
jgi:hypothetical protein